MSTYVYPLSYTEGKLCPVSELDHVVYRDTAPEVKYFCPSTGEPFTADSYRLCLENAKNKQYPGTDHTPFLITVNGVSFLYVSLDNSVRANMSGYSLVSSRRLQRLCEIVNKISPDVVFFSEACRKSFEGGMNEQKNPVYWMEIRSTITSATDMTFLLESTNNFDVNCMSFGVAAFAKPGSLARIRNVQAYSLLREEPERKCFGSGSVVVTLTTGEAVVGVHFPLDFANAHEENNVGRAMSSLVNLLNKYEIAYAIGDMNTIEGVMSTAVDEALEKEGWQMTRGQLTFFPSYYDCLAREENVTELHPDTL